MTSAVYTGLIRASTASAILVHADKEIRNKITNAATKHLFIIPSPCQIPKPLSLINLCSFYHQKN
jgi:hypothetical protein